MDDPYAFGQIAAANALSDVYAMGGDPKLALNVFCFPETLPKDAVQAILQGGYEKVQEAEAIITGGHTIQDQEPKYGLSVTGFIQPSQVLTNGNVKPGDILILTKALGTGILTTAARADLLEASEYKILVDSMATLNKTAGQMMRRYPVNSCTDITGFGMLGHAFEMAYASGCTLHLQNSKLPILPEVIDLAENGIIPAGAYRNRTYLEDVVLVKEDVSLAIEDLLYDPQTSGGLLISLPEKEGVKLIKELKDYIPVAEVIGWAEDIEDYSIVVE